MLRTGSRSFQRGTVGLCRSIGIKVTSWQSWRSKKILPLCLAQAKQVRTGKSGRFCNNNGASTVDTVFKKLVAAIVLRALAIQKILKVKLPPRRLLISEMVSKTL